MEQSKPWDRDEALIDHWLRVREDAEKNIQVANENITRLQAIRQAIFKMSFGQIDE